MVAHPWYDFDMVDPILNQTLLYYLGSTWQGLADIGECLDTASRVEEDEYSWQREWRKTAERIHKFAETKCENKGHPISAGEAYLRAANYYIAALHRYPEPHDPDVAKMAQQSTHCFRKALHHLPLHGVPVDIPYEKTTLPGYFFRSPHARNDSPVLIVHQGRDGWAEHCLFLADGALKRGDHCLLFDGPGQGKVIRLQGLRSRPDWENVIAPVVDFVIDQPGVDPNRIALMGISMGGALVPRAAAFEKRLKICIVNPGGYRWSDVHYEFIANAMGITTDEVEKLVETAPETFNAEIAAIMENNALARWGIKDVMWKHGAASPADLMLKVKAFTNEHIVEQISCRMLVMDGEADEFSQARKLFKALKAPKKYICFKEEETAMLHCQVGALAYSSGTLFNWLDEYL